MLILNHDFKVAFLRFLTAILLLSGLFLPFQPKPTEAVSNSPSPAALPILPSTFPSSPTYKVGNSPYSVSVADFNGDGQPDLATGNTADGTVSVLLAKGDGTYNNAVNYPAGSYPYVSSGDLNEDGKPDLVTSGGSGVNILLGNGDGTFQSAVSYPINSGAYNAVVADFNGDGKSDIAAVSTTNLAGNNYSSVNVLIGKGDGTFQASVSYSAGYGAQFIVLADFNSDQIVDLLTINKTSSTISTLTGKGDGTFQPALTFGVANAPDAAATGDFNGDGKPDFVTANLNSENASVFLGNGDGTFLVGQVYPTGPYSESVAVGDFNGDGKPDFANADGNLHIFLGDGQGNFQEKSLYTFWTNTYTVVSYDLNKDEKLDLVLADGYNDLFVAYSNGDGIFQSTPFIKTTFGTTEDITVADLNGDNKPDIIAGSSAITNREGNYNSSSNISVILSNGKGAFQEPLNYTTSTYSSAVITADFNLDGKPDIAAVNPRDNSISILLGIGNGSFETTANIPVSNSPQSIALGDFNGDHKLDLVVGGSSLAFLPGNDDGTFQAPIFSSTPSSITRMVVGDFNKDYRLDLAFVNGASAHVMRGNGSGSFTDATVYLTGSGAVDIGTVDLNKDNQLDLILVNYSLSTYSSSVRILTGNGDGTFQVAQDYFLERYTRRLVIGDFNGDNVPDIATSNLYFLAGNGDGTFATPIILDQRPTGPVIAAGNLNGDGKLDLVIGKYFGLGILLNQAPDNPKTLVYNPDDNGKGDVPGSLSFALLAANNGTDKKVTFSSGITKVTISGQLLPAVAEGVSIEGRCNRDSGPEIILDGSNMTGDGLILDDYVNLYGLQVTNFKGAQIKVKHTGHTGYSPVKLQCVKAIASQ